MPRQQIMLLAITLFLALACFSSCSPENEVSETMVEQINLKCNKEGNCIIEMNEIVHFKWDKAVFFEVGSSSEEVSSLLGVDFKGMNEFNYGMVFAYQNKIVYKEVFSPPIEKPNKFEIDIIDANTRNALISPDNSTVNARKYLYVSEDRYCYTVEISIKDTGTVRNH